MKPNRVRELLIEGKVPVGHMIDEFATRGIAKIVQGAGVDFVLLDMEHGGIGFSRIADLLAWFKATPVAPFVRVPSAGYHFIARVMDAGAMGVMVPNVLDAEHAKRINGAMRFAPEGYRGLGLGMAHNNYLPPNPVEYMAEANRNNLVICQIESVQGVENAEAIAALPGTDVLWVGHFDLSQSMGIVGQFHHEKFLDALRRVAQAAHKNGKAAGIQPGTIEQAREWMELGYNLISFSSDFNVYRAALQSSVEKLREMRKQPQ